MSHESGHLRIHLGIVEVSGLHLRWDKHCRVCAQILGVKSAILTQRHNGTTQVSGICEIVYL